MNAKNAPETFQTRISHADMRRLVAEAERMRAEHIAGLLRSVGCGIARLARAVVKPRAVTDQRHEPFRPQPRYN